MYDLEEQETIDTLKAWWKDNGKWVWIGIAVALATYAGVQGWRHYQRTQAEKAGALFEPIREAAGKDDAAKTLAAAKALQDAQPGSPLAVRGALIAAALSHAHGDDSAALAELDWVSLHSGERALADLARVRAAGVLADQKKYDEAIHLLDANKDPLFAALTADRRGDILVSEQKWNDARAAYQVAVEKSPADGALKQIAQSKLDALGGKP